MATGSSAGTGSDDSDEELSQELTEKLLHFQEITNIDDLSRCKELLRQHSWNVESAVQATFLDGPPHAPENVQSDVILPQRELRRRNVGTISPPLPMRNYSHTSLYEARRIRHFHQPQGILGWTYYIVSFPFRLTWNTVFSLLRFFMRIFIPDPRARVTNALGDVRGFIKEYEEKFGRRHPQFFEGTYSDAQSESRKRMQFLLVYLHGPDHRDTPGFCADTLSNEDVIALVDRNCIFWGCSVGSPEGYRVSRALHENTYPFFALICQYQGKMTVVGRLEGPLTPQEFMEQVSGLIERFEPTMVAARAERAERDITQQIRNEQDAAYEQSLLQDKEKEEKKKMEEENKRKREREIEEKALRKKEAEERYQKRKQACKEACANECESSDPDALRLLIKLPDGSRFNRVFLSSQPVKSIHDFVFCQESAPRQFHIVTNFPRRVIPGCSTEEVLALEEKSLNLAHQEDVGGDGGENKRNHVKVGLTIAEAGLKSSEMLFVQALDDTDDEDSDS